MKQFFLKIKLLSQFILFNSRTLPVEAETIDWDSKMVLSSLMWLNSLYHPTIVLHEAKFLRTEMLLLDPYTPYPYMLVVAGTCNYKFHYLLQLPRNDFLRPTHFFDKDNKSVCFGAFSKRCSHFDGVPKQYSKCISNLHCLLTENHT